MADQPKYYIETTVLIDALDKPVSDEGNAALFQLFSDADDGKCTLITSAVTMVEVLFAEHEKKNGRLSAEVTAKLDTFWHPDSSPLRIIPCHEAITREALSTYREYWAKEDWRKSKGKDLVHLVTAKREGVDIFITTETAMKKWAAPMGFSVCTPKEALDSLSPPSLFKE
jgi:predicted nucleic acid-binding protein